MAGRRILAICFDFGDTLADEATEVKDATGTTIRAELLPGAAETLRELHRRGYPLALVADGRPGTYRNVLTQHGLYDLFSAFAISEEMGVEKPHPRMFLHALEALGVPPEAAGRTVMVGNRLERDVLGANRVGIISVWLAGSPRYRQQPHGPEEQPDFTIRRLGELLEVIEQLEQEAALGHHPLVT